jgi:2-C-methyl-D-erythritol 4-phosphate cytidylyltransferase
MGEAKPKQFIDLGGKPIICWTVQRFREYNPSLKITVVVHVEYKSLCREIFEKEEIGSEINFVDGGDTRFQSVKNGLNSLDNELGIVAVHDSVRPFVSINTIEACFETARIKGNAVPVIPVFESMRMVVGAGTEIVDRSAFRIVQTPQCFEKSLIVDAYKQEFRNAFTDDASVVEFLNVPINLVDGNRDNIKITTKADFRIACGLIS